MPDLIRLIIIEFNIEPRQFSLKVTI